MDTKLIISDLGGPAKVAKELEITSQAVSQWRVVPARHCLKLAEMSAGRFTVHDLRPDFFGHAPSKEAA